MKQKTLLIALLLLPCFVYSGKPVIVGQVNMISTRNVDSGVKYELLCRGVNDSKKALKDLRALTLDGAINNAVLNVPGGEFLKNVKIYFDGKYFSVVGDVWGLEDNRQIEGFTVGDVVLMKNNWLTTGTMGDKFEKVTITGFKDRKTCLVKTESGEIKEADFSKLSKTDY